MKKILVIDDEPMVRSYLRTMLEREGYEVKEAANGEEGVQLFHSFSPQLIITDMVMPGKDGIEVIMELRKVDTSVKIMAISGGGYITADKYLALAKALDIDACFQKPLDPQMIISTVKDLIGT